MDWCTQTRAGLFPDFIHGVTTDKASSCLPRPLGMAYIPRAERPGGTEVSFRKSNFNICPCYLCAPHNGRVFLLLLLLTSCLFPLLEPDRSWRIRSWFGSCAEILENVFVVFNWVLGAFANVSSVGVSVLQDWDIQSQADELSLSVRESWFRVRRAAARIIFSLLQ